MSLKKETEGETKVIKSAKAIKRVRFSEDVKCVAFAESDDSASVSLENESKNASEIFASLSEHEDLPQEHETLDVNDEAPDYSSIPDDNNNNELLSCPQMITGTYQTFPQISDSSEDECIDDQPESHISDNELKDGNSLEPQDLIELVNETMSMVISSVERGGSTSEMLLEERISYPVSSSETNSEKIFQDPVRDIKQKIGISCLSRKRSLEGFLVEKQTSKLNDCLSKNNSDFKSAGELKSAVYNAWNIVKSESSVVQNQLKSNPAMIKSNPKAQKSDSGNVFEMWKRSKVKSKKVGHKLTESASQKSKSESDLEESKLAFKAWKKRKDEILKQKMAEKLRNEEKEKFDSLMSEKIRKNDAESAFSAWNAHKSVTLKLEKKKNRWFSEKEREKLHMKMKKNEEAAKMYEEWLRNKVYAADTYKYQKFEDKPPWTPPGKGNNII